MPAPLARVKRLIVHVEDMLALYHGVLRLSTPLLIDWILPVSNGLVEWVELGIMKKIDFGLLAMLDEHTGSGTH